jgi:hypothetical protein
LWKEPGKFQQAQTDSPGINGTIKTQARREQLLRRDKQNTQHTGYREQETGSPAILGVSYREARKT